MTPNCKLPALLRATAALACLAIGYTSAASATAAPDPLYSAYVEPRDLATLPDGRTIHLFCAGGGSPTVILTAGFSDWSAQWGKVFAPIAAHTRTCSWDRAGYGFSGPGTLPQDVQHTTADLEAALKAADVTGPYVMVGHSMGGFESLLFTDKHRDAVVGMVLVDPSIPGQARLVKAAAPKFSLAQDQMGEQYIQKKTGCAARIESGKLTPGSADPDNCFSYNPDYPKELQDALQQLDRNPARWKTRVSAMTELKRNSEEVENPQRNYGAMPLRVLGSSDLGEMPTNFDAATLAQAPAFEAVFLRGHEALAALSSRGSHVVVPGTTHYIQLIKPEVVIANVLQVVDETRAGKK